MCSIYTSKRPDKNDFQWEPSIPDGWTDSCDETNGHFSHFVRERAEKTHFGTADCSYPIFHDSSVFKRLCAETRDNVITHVLLGRATLCLSKTLDSVLLFLYGVHFAPILKSTFQTWVKSCYSRSK